MSAKITVFSLDEHPVVRDGITSAVNSQPDLSLVGQAATGQEAINYFRRHRADVILMDLKLPDMSGIQAMIDIRANLPHARFIVFTSVAYGSEIRRALAEGALAYLLKSMPSHELVDAIRHVHSGKRKIPTSIAARLAEHCNDKLLSDREVQVLRQLADGNTNRDISNNLSIGEETVKSYMQNIMEKLGAKNRTHALAIALRRGVIQL